MAYAQNQQENFDFEVDNTNDTTYGGPSLAYHENNVNVDHHPLVAPVTDPQMLSHGDNHMQQAQYRRDSFANSVGISSPAGNVPVWPAKYRTNDNNHGMPMATQQYHFADQPFVRHDSTHYYNAGPFAVEQSEANTPLTSEGMQLKTEAYQQPHMHDLVQQSPSCFTPIQQQPNSKSVPQMQVPMSPHSHEDWKAMSTLEQAGRAFPTHMRITSPSKHLEKRRSDGGVRKKNAKIDIPEGRTVPVIEALMEREQDELLLKELKSQKRLLRNREAALASRQRKKKHTEELEVESKDLRTIIAALETDLQETQQRCDAETSRRQFFEQRLQDSEITISSLRQEKEHMVAQNTQAIISLRQEIAALRDPIVSPAPAMSLAPSSTGFTDLNSDMDHLNFSAQDWDKHLRFFNHEGHELNDWEMIQNDRSSGSQGTIQPFKLLSPTDLPESRKPGESDPQIPSGVLFMLLLCGAFVAANSTQKAPPIPRMPDEVRAVSNTVLSNLLDSSKSNGSLDASKQFGLDVTNTFENHNTAWSSQVPDNSNIAAMHRHLTSPTKRQLAAQASMLTPEQYNSLTQSSPVFDMPHRPVSKRNLAEILSNMRNEQIVKGSKADVYTRSLLWDQVPEDVIKQFKEAVRDGRQPSTSQSGPSKNGAVDSKLGS